MWIKHYHLFYMCLIHVASFFKMLSNELNLMIIFHVQKYHADLNFNMHFISWFMANGILIKAKLFRLRKKRSHFIRNILRESRGRRKYLKIMLFLFSFNLWVHWNVKNLSFIFLDFFLSYRKPWLLEFMSTWKQIWSSLSSRQNVMFAYYC